MGQADLAAGVSSHMSFLSNYKTRMKQPCFFEFTPSIPFLAVRFAVQCVCNLRPGWNLAMSLSFQYHCRKERGHA